MSELATDSYADRRSDFRRPASRSAELLIGDGEGYGCVILDESDGGLQVETEQPLDLPEQLFIKFSDQASQLVRRCWASGTRAGYQFIEIVPAKRRGADIPAAVNDAPAEAFGGEAVGGEADLAAVNDFISIAHALLDLSGVPGGSDEADQIQELLAALPHARLQLAHRGSGGQVVQLFAIPQAWRDPPRQHRR
jgi:hypothetical protein